MTSFFSKPVWGSSLPQLKEETEYIEPTEPPKPILKSEPVTGLHAGGATHSRTVNWPEAPPSVKVVPRWIGPEHTFSRKRKRPRRQSVISEISRWISEWSSRRVRTPSPKHTPVTPPRVIIPVNRAAPPIGSEDHYHQHVPKWLQDWFKINNPPPRDSTPLLSPATPLGFDESGDDEDYPEWLQDWESCSFLIAYLKQNTTAASVLRTIRDTGRVFWCEVGTVERSQSRERCDFAEIVFFPSDKARKFGQNSVNPVDETTSRLGQESIDRAKTTWTPPIQKRTKRKPATHHKRKKKDHTEPKAKKHGSKPTRMLLKMDDHDESHYNAVIYGDHPMAEDPRKLIEIALRDGSITSRSTRTLMINGPLWLVNSLKLDEYLRGHFEYYVRPEFTRDYPAESTIRPWRFYNDKFTREHPNRPKTTTVEWREVTHDKVNVGYGEDPCEFTWNHVSLALGGWETKEKVPFMYEPGSLYYDPETGKVMMRVVEKEPVSPSKPPSPSSVTFSEKPSYFVFSDDDDDDDEDDKPEHPAEKLSYSFLSGYHDEDYKPESDESDEPWNGTPAGPHKKKKASKEERGLVLYDRLGSEAYYQKKTKETGDKLMRWRDWKGRSILSTPEFRIRREQKIAAAKEAEEAREAAIKAVEEARKAAEAAREAAAIEDAKPKPWRDESGKVILTPYDYRMQLRQKAADEERERRRKIGRAAVDRLDDRAWKDAYSGKVKLTPYEFRMQQRRALVLLDPEDER
ncbi:hypothetical protein QBC37DRAFT_375632 [Rhypophila decipiens]|uniref:Uncharacterized protein n=1 Tax=Rhypophila decipiens TaxID=261697 RepID=A0AAN7B6J2_9PEZI|nr:hypothetical protein QBC37DRAFT_375632 [Rhypophila decipiens]